MKLSKFIYANYPWKIDCLSLALCYQRHPTAVDETDSKFYDSDNLK